MWRASVSDGEKGMSLSKRQRNEVECNIEIELILQETEQENVSHLYHVHLLESRTFTEQDGSDCIVPVTAYS